MDGYELGGRVIKARTYAPAIFSRIATSPTSCLPLSFANLPRSAGQSTFRSPFFFYENSKSTQGIGKDWKNMGTINMEINVVKVGEENRLKKGFSNYLKRSEG